MEESNSVRQINEAIKAKLEAISGGVSPYYREIFNAVSSEDEAKKTEKEAELKLRETIALAKSAYKTVKGKQVLDVGSVKMTALNVAITVNGGGVDKLEEANDLKNDYLAMIESGEIPKGQVESLDMLRNSLKEQKAQVKDTKEGMKTKVDSEIAEALFVIAKEELILIKAAEAEDGESVKRQKKNPLGPDGDRLVSVLKNFLGK